MICLTKNNEICKLNQAILRKKPMEKIYECPPLHCLMQIADNCPKSISTYLFLLKNKDQNFLIKIFKEDIKPFFHLSPIKLRNDLNKLSKTGVILVEENQYSYDIELIFWNK